VKKLGIILGLMSLLLFMLPLVSTAIVTTESPPAAINGNEFALVITNPSATIVYANDMLMDNGASNTNIDLTMADIVNENAAQITGYNVASTAQMNTGTIVEGANVVIKGKTTSLNGTPMTIIANMFPADGFTFFNADIRSKSTGADAQQFNSEVAFVLEIEISAGATVDNTGLADYTWARSDNLALSGLVAAELKMPINIFENNTGALTHTVYILSMANTASNPSTANVTIGDPISLAGQSVDSRATFPSEANGFNTISTDNTFYFDENTAMVQNEEDRADAEDLVVVANNTLLPSTWMGNTGTRTTTMVADNSLMNTIDTDAMFRPATTLYAEMNAKGVNGDGLVVWNFA